MTETNKPYVRITLDLPWDAEWKPGEYVQVPFTMDAIRGERSTHHSHGRGCVPVIRDRDGDIIFHVDPFVGELCGTANFIARFSKG